MNIAEKIDKKGTECLNTDDDVLAVFEGTKPVRSDADAQLLFNLKFRGDTGLSSVAFTGPSDGTSTRVCGIVGCRGLGANVQAAVVWANGEQDRRRRPCGCL